MSNFLKAINNLSLTLGGIRFFMYIYKLELQQASYKQGTNSDSYNKFQAIDTFCLFLSQPELPFSF